MSSLYALLGGCPLGGKSSMCMITLKYRIILLIVIKYPWVILLAYFLLRGTAPYPAGVLTVPPKPFDIPTFGSASIPFRHLAINLICRSAVATSILLTRKLQRKHRKMWQNLLWFFVVKNKGQTQKAVAQRSRIGYM